MNELISVIVPVYNVEKYLRKCIDSIRKQTYLNLEIILVNDGSTDNSDKICNEYAKEDKRIRVINKTNGGLSSARNSGLEVANGTFIAFVDSDDWIESNMIEKMLSVALKEKADIVHCGIKQVGENGDIYKVLFEDNIILNSNDEILRAYFTEEISVIVCNKLFKRKVIDNIRMIEGKNNEDNMYCIEVLLRTNKLVSISDAFYNYLQRNDSITKAQFTEKRMDAIYSGNYVLNICDKYAKEYSNYAKINLCLICYYLYQDLMISNNQNKAEYKEQIIKEFNKNYTQIKKTNEIKQIKFKNKLKILCFLKVKSLLVIARKTLKEIYK